MEIRRILAKIRLRNHFSVFLVDSETVSSFSFFGFFTEEDGPTQEGFFGGEHVQVRITEAKHRRSSENVVSELEDEIERWIKAANVALQILFRSERWLCARVFFGLSLAADLSFMEVCRGSTIQLLNFADAIAIGSRSPERFFKVLDVFETLRDLMPEFDALFSDQYCLFLRTEAATIWKRLGAPISTVCSSGLKRRRSGKLGEAIRGIFMELENFGKKQVLIYGKDLIQYRDSQLILD